MLDRERGTFREMVGRDERKPMEGRPSRYMDDQPHMDFGCMHNSELGGNVNCDGQGPHVTLWALVRGSGDPFVPRRLFCAIFAKHSWTSPNPVDVIAQNIMLLDSEAIGS